MALQLMASVSGPALETLCELDVESKKKFSSVKSALLARFEGPHLSVQSKILLKSRRRGKDESLVELAQDARRLVRRAYPGTSLDDCIKDELATDCFLDALPDERMILTVKMDNPTSLDHALQLASNYESSIIASNARQSLVYVPNDETPPNFPSNKKPFRDLDNSNGSSAHRAKSTPSLGCWHCGEPDHRKRTCPKMSCFGCGVIGHIRRDCSNKHLWKSS